LSSISTSGKTKNRRVSGSPRKRRYRPSDREPASENVLQQERGEPGEQRTYTGREV
jgi:hypothetical protein